MLYPTTVGTGPFKPAIAFDATLWVFDFEFPTEQEAYTRAHEEFTAASKAFTDKLKAREWKPRAHQ